MISPSHLLGLGLALVVGFIGYWFAAPRSTSFGMFEGFDNSTSFRFFASFTATLAGVALGSFYRELSELRSKGVRKIEQLGTLFKDVGKSTDLWLGLAGTPIVYSLLLKATDGMSLPGLIIVALQNGFCCLIILNSFH